MGFRRRHLPLRAFLLLGMVLWIFGSFATQIHRAWVQHGTCSEGDVVELRDDHEDHDGPVLVKGHAHDQDCPMGHGLPTPDTLRPLAHATLVQALPLEAVQRPPVAVTPPPPLRNAPKTSPPVLA